MNNLLLPAYPIGEDDFNRFSDCRGPWTGFTKLELASLMIAQGLIQQGFVAQDDIVYIKTHSVRVAKAVLEEANK
jgi:hypothetical protein